MKHLLLFWLGLTLSSVALTETELEAERQSQTATAFTILFDSSGSMSKNNKITQAKQAFSVWLSSQNPADAFSLIHFAREGTLAVPLQKNNLEQVQAVVKKLQANGQTPIVNCLRIAHQNIQERRKTYSPYERHLVVVFTDGGESLDARGNKGVVSEIKKLTRDNIEVVGIGFHGQGAYMSKSATSYYDAYNTEELKETLTKVAAEIDPNAEVYMTEQDRKRMENLDLNPPTAKVKAESAAGVPQTTQTQTTSKKRGLFSKFPFAIFIVVAFLLLKKIF